jgi:hypothetical protein
MSRRHHHHRRSEMPRLASELAFAAVQQGAMPELLPGSPATIVVNRGGQLLALLVGGDEGSARKILGLPATPQRDPAAELLFEVDRRHYTDEEERYAC